MHRECRVLVEAVKRVVKGMALGSGSYVVVFGSVAEGRCSSLSDIDLFVKGIGLEEVGRLAEALESATGRRIEIVFAERASLPILYEALGHGVFVGGDYWAFVEDKWRSVLKWLDFAEAYERMHKSYRRRVLSSRAASPGS